MKNFKLYLIAGAVLLVISAVATIKIQNNIIKRNRTTISRISENNYQLMSDLHQQTNLVLTQKEITGRLKKERDSLSKALKINPKQVEKIVYIDNSTHDTVRVNVPITIIRKNEWLLRDSTECLQYASKLILRGDTLTAQRQLLEYNNRTTEVFYRLRPHKFLFIHFGKWENHQTISSECGGVTQKTFNFIK